MIPEKAIMTTMIGALNEFEKTFGHLWGHGLMEGDTTEEQDLFYDQYMDMRDRILDLGNEQINKINRKRKR